MKKKILIWILVITVYILSALHNWLWMNKAFSKGGRWERLDADAVALVFTFMPFVNTMAVIGIFLESSQDSNIPNKIFNIKK